MNNLITIIRKELKDIFRDKKTLIFTLLIPIVLYPALFAFMNNSMKENEKQVEQNISIGIRDKGSSDITAMFKKDKKFTVFQDDKLDEELKKGKISAIVEIPEDFNSKIGEEKISDIKIIYDEESTISQMALGAVQSYLNQYSNQIVQTRLEKRGMDKNVINPFTVESVTNKKNQESNPMGVAILNMIPTFIILFMFAPTVAVAADLGAGEKERGTLEPLLTTSVKRASILWAKVATISIVALVTLVISVLAMGVSLNLIFDNAAKSLDLTPQAMLLIMAFSMLFLVVVAAVEMAVSIYSRSMKEANSYLSGVMIANMIFMYIPMMADSKNLKSIYFHIPVTNIVCILKEFTVGIYNTSHMLTVLGWMVLYIVLAVLFARHMFSREEVVFRA